MAAKRYGYESGYGSGAPDAAAPEAPTQTYGYESGYGSNNATPTDVALSKAGAAYDTLNQMAPWNVLRAHTLQPAADAVAEQGGRLGYPKTGAALGTAIAISPEILSAYTSLRGIYNSANPIVKGLMNTPQELGPQYAAQNEAVGLRARPPEQSGANLKFPNPYGENTLTTRPPAAIQVDTNIPSNLRGADALPSTTPVKYPNNPASLINAADQRISQFGPQLNQQELSDYKALLDQNIGDPNKIPKFIDGKKNPLYAQASQVRAKVSDLLNQVIEPKLAGANLPEGTMPTRAGLNQAYGVASKQQALTELIKKYGLKGIELAGGGLAGKQLYDYFKK